MMTPSPVPPYRRVIAAERDGKVADRPQRAGWRAAAESLSDPGDDGWNAHAQRVVAAGLWHSSATSGARVAWAVWLHGVLSGSEVTVDAGR